MTRTVVLFADSDSQIFGALGHANSFLERGWTVRFVVEKPKNIPEAVYQKISSCFDVIELNISQLPQFLEQNRSSIDVVGVFSKASKICQFRLSFEEVFEAKPGPRPGIFNGFNGLSYERFEEGISWRLGYDVIALNGPRDIQLFEGFVGFGPWKKQPFVVTGLAQSNSNDNSEKLLRKRPRLQHCRKKFVFAEQVVVPSSLSERRYLLAELIRLANENPDWDVIIKCRVKPSEKTFHKSKFHPQNLLKEFRNRPDNLILSYEPLSKLFKDTDLFATVSSTAIFEAIKENIPSFVIADYGIKNHLGTHVFIGCGVPVCLDEIQDLSDLETYKICSEWLEWVGAKKVRKGALVDFFEAERFNSNKYEPSYMTAKRMKTWTIAKKKFVFKSSIRYLLRLIGVYPSHFR